MQRPSDWWAGTPAPVRTLLTGIMIMGVGALLADAAYHSAMPNELFVVGVVVAVYANGMLISAVWSMQQEMSSAD